MRKLKLFLDAKTANTPPRGISKASRVIFSVLTLLLLSVGNVWATETTYSLTPNATSTGSSATSYQTSLTFTYEGIGWAMAYINPSTRQTKTNQSSATAEFNFHNTSAFPGRITKVVVTYSALTVATGKASEFKFLGGTSEVTATTGGDAATWNSTNKTMTWTPAANTNYTYFAYYMNGKTATGSNYLAESDAIVVTYETSGGGKTLTSIAVSGAPTKTAYYVGDEFDPAGLVVTGTYSDDSQAAITSGITWAYDPSQELALNQTSIGVTATVNEISSPKFNVTGLSVTAPVVSNWQVTAPADLETGDVVVLTMLKNSVYYAAPNNGSGAPAATVVAVANSKLSNPPAETLQWTVTVVEDGVYQFSKGTNYLKCTDTNNGVKVGTGDYNTFDVVVENEKSYLHTTETMTSATNGRYLGIYNTQDWRCYSSVNNNIKDGSLVIFREPASSKESAGLAFADANHLVKVNGSLDAPALTNPHGLTVTYASSDANVVAVSSDGATLTIKAAGKAVITASSEETTVYKAGSASYTIFVAEQAGTAEDPLTEASAKDLIDLGCTMSAHVTGTIQGKTYYSNSGSYNVTLTNGFLFYYFYAAANSTPFESDILTNGDELVGYGQLMKYGNNYEINPSYMVSRIPYSEPLVDISNTPETAYTPAYAIQLYNDPTSDLTKEVYVKGVVVATPALKYNDGLTGDAAVYNGTYNVYVKAEDDLSENPTKFEFFRMYADDNNTTFEDGDIQVGEVIIAKGILSKYNSTYEFAQGCQMVSKKSKATMTFDNLEMVVNDEKALAPKTITLATAEAVTYAIKEGSDDCITLANGVVTATAEGTATIVATVATVEAYIGTSVEFTVTVSAAAPVLTDYYEKVTETENITDGTYLIVYENGNVAFNGGLETLDAESNTIAVAITNDNKIGVTEATAAATFFIDVTAGSIQAANGKYIGVSSNSNGLKTSDDASTYTNAFAIDNDGNAVISAVFSGSTMTMRYNSASNQARFRYYKDNGQQAIQLYKLANETVKANPELAWSEDVEITLGDDFTAPTMSHADGFSGTITYSSDNEELATVNENGVISLVADATGTAHITASFAGDDDYKAMSATCTITVNAAPTPAGTDNVVILAVYDEKYYAMSTTNANNGFTAIAVEYDGSQITVKSEAEKTAIQWTRTTNGNNTTFQDADSKYMKSADGASMSLDANVCNWLWDATGGYYKISGTSRTFFFQNTNGGIFKNYAVSNFDKTGYSGKAQVIVIDPANIVITSKVSAELAYDPAEVELTVGDDFTPAALTYAEGFDGLATVIYESSNTDLATVEGGVVSLVADATGTATITATFAGNNNYLAGSASYTITVNAPAPVPTTTTYRKVTATEEITDGEYLIVYETTSVAFNGALETLDAEGNSVAVVINEGVIAGTTAIDAAVFTIDVTDGTLQSASGKYIGVSSNSNGLKQTEDASTYTHTFSIDGDGNAVIFANFENSTMKLRYNSSTNAGNLRFRYYKNGGQQAIQLYKKETVTPEPQYTVVRTDLTAGWYYTMCLDKAVTAVKAGSIWKVVSKAENGKDVILEDVEGTLDAGRPYIFLATASTLEVAYTGAAVAAPLTEGNNGLIGSFTQELIAQSTNNYIIYNNALYFVNSEAYVGAHRAYLDMTGVPAYNGSALAPGRRRVNMSVYGEQTATGMDALNATDAPVKMMINGQLFILRGEKMYDTTGRLVK